MLKSTQRKISSEHVGLYQSIKTINLSGKSSSAI